MAIQLAEAVLEYAAPPLPNATPSCDWYRFGLQRCGERASWSSQARGNSDFHGRLLCTRHARKLTLWALTEGCPHELVFKHLPSGETLDAASIDIRVVRDADIPPTPRPAAR